MTIGVVVVLVLVLVPALEVDVFPDDAGPTGTIGVSEVDLLVESESGEDVAGGF